MFCTDVLREIMDELVEEALLLVEVLLHNLAKVKNPNNKPE